ncbi:MAG: hypothetical protein MUC44_05580 [Beijerinckiaceae bacterium]|nr:hypothetical protein [Beijerinckiaceae bacterium]
MDRHVSQRVGAANECQGQAASWLLPDRLIVRLCRDGKRNHRLRHALAKPPPDRQRLARWRGGWFDAITIE